MKIFDGLHPQVNTIVTVVLIIIGATILSRVLKWLVKKSFVAASDKVHIDPTRYKFFRNAISFIIWLIAAAAIISLVPELKALAITLFAGAGILVAIIGFAAQQAFSNIVSGLFIVLFKPFRVNDVIKVGNGSYGIVEDITLRHTVIKNFENKRIIIPNAVMSSETIVNDNIEDSKVCRWVEVGISYDSDVELAFKIMQEVAMQHPLCIDVRTEEQKNNGDPQVVVRFLNFGDSSLNLRAYVWSGSPTQAFQMHSDLNLAIKKRFDEEGIEIPFPHRTLIYKNDPSKAVES